MLAAVLSIKTDANGTSNNFGINHPSNHLHGNLLMVYVLTQTSARQFLFKNLSVPKTSTRPKAWRLPTVGHSPSNAIPTSLLSRFTKLKCQDWIRAGRTIYSSHAVETPSATRLSSSVSPAPIIVGSGHLYDYVKMMPMGKYVDGEF